MLPGPPTPAGRADRLRGYLVMNDTAVAIDLVPLAPLRPIHERTHWCCLRRSRLDSIQLPNVRSRPPGPVSRPRPHILGGKANIPTRSRNSPPPRTLSIYP